MESLFTVFIYRLDVKPTAMLHEENKQYTVKRSEPRYNRDILIYSLISSLLCGSWMPPPTLSYNYPISFSFSPRPSLFFLFLFFISFTCAFFLSLSFSLPQLLFLYLLTLPLLHLLNPVDSLIRGLV